MAGTVHALTPSTTRIRTTRIRKQPRPGAPAPNLADYDAARRAFTWEAARGRARRAARRAGPEHRARGGRPPRRTARGRPGGAALARPPAASGASSPTASWPTRRTASPTCSPASASRAASACSRCSGRVPELLRRRARHAEARQRVLARCSRPSVPSRSASAWRIGDGRVLVTTPDALPAQGRADPRRSCPSLEHVLLVGRPTTPASARARCDLHAAAGGASDGLRDRPHRPEDLALLHFTSGTTGTPEGRDARARGRRRAPRDRRARARPARRRRLLVHRRSRLGHRHVVRHHRAARRTA